MTEQQTWPGVFAVALWQIVASACYYAPFAATASFRATFGISRFEVGVLLAALTLGYTVFLFPAGMIVDGYGDLPAMVLGLVGLAAGAAGISVATSFPVLVVAILVLGASYASAMPATNRAIAVRAPAGRYNLAVGVKQVGVTLGSAISAVTVTSLAGGLGSWRTAFLAVSGAAIAGAVAYAIFYEGAPGVGESGLPDLSGLADNRTYVLLAAAGFFIGSAVFTTTGYLVPYFDEGIGVSLGTAGLALATMQVTGSIGRVGVGAIADRLGGSTAGASLTVVAVQVVAGAALFAVFPFVGVTVGFVTVALLGLAVLGVTGLYHGTLVALVPDEQSGAATAAGQTTLNVGGLIAPPLFGFLADGYGYTGGWLLLGGFAVAAGVLLTSARRAHPS